MKKKKRTLMSFALMATILFVALSGCGNTGFQRELEILPTRFDTEYNICEARFTITLTSETSLKFLPYTVADFPAVFSELRLAGVEEITPDSQWRWAQGLVLLLETGDWGGLPWATGSDEEVIELILSLLTQFTRVLTITLAEPSRVNVLQAMRIFEEREDVLYVTPDFLPWPEMDPGVAEELLRQRFPIDYYFGTFNGVVVFAHRVASPHGNSFVFKDMYFIHFAGLSGVIRAWVPCENNENGNVFVIGEEFDSWSFVPPAEICWQEILTIDHVRSMYQRHHAGETRRRR